MSLRSLFGQNSFTIFAKDSNVEDDLKIGTLTIVGDDINNSFTTTQLYNAVIGGGGGGGSLPDDMEPNNILVALTNSTVQTSNVFETTVHCSAPLSVDNVLTCQNQLNLGLLTINDDLDDDQTITTQNLYDVVNGSGGTVPSNMEIGNFVIALSNSTLNTADHYDGAISTSSDIETTGTMSCNQMLVASSQVFGNLTINNTLSTVETVTNEQLYEAIIGSGGTIPTDLQPNDIIVALTNSTISSANNLGGDIQTDTNILSNGTIRSTDTVTGQNIVIGGDGVSNGLTIQGDTTLATRTAAALLNAIDNPGGGGGIPSNLQTGTLVYADSSATIQTVNTSLTAVKSTVPLNVIPATNNASGFSVRSSGNDLLFNVNTISGVTVTKNNQLDNGSGGMVCASLDTPILKHNSNITLQNNLLPSSVNINIGSGSAKFDNIYSINEICSYVSVATGINLNNLHILADASTGSITGTELSYLSGATSNIQNQINSIAPPCFARFYSGNNNINNGGTANIFIQYTDYRSGSNAPYIISDSTVKFTITGYYSYTYNVEFSLGGSGSGGITFSQRKNGSTIFATPNSVYATNGMTTGHFTVTNYINITSTSDYISLNVTNNSGATMTYDQSYITVTRLG